MNTTTLPPRSPRRRQQASRLAAALLWSACLIPGAAQAADGTWSGGSTENDFWSNSENWSGGTIPGVVWDPEAEEWNYDVVTLDRAVLPGDRTITLDDNYQIGRLTLATPGSEGNGVYTINAAEGQSLRFAGVPGGYSLSGNWSTSTTQFIINAPVIFDAPSGEDITHGVWLSNYIEIHGPISGGNTAGKITLDIESNSNGRLSLLGDISDGGAEEGVALLIRGSTILGRVGGGNTFSGGVTLNTAERSLTLQNDTALGSGVFHFVKGTITGSHGITIANKMVLEESVAFQNTGGNQTQKGLTFTGDIEIAAGAETLTISNNSGTIWFEGVVSDAEGSSRKIVKSGAGTVAFTRDNTFSGGVELRSGSLQIDHANALGSGDLTIISEATLRGKAAFGNKVEIFNRVNFSGATGLDLQGDVYLKGTDAVQIFGMDSSGSFAISGDIHEGEITKGLRMTGRNSQIILGGNNDFTGGIAIEANSGGNYFRLGIGHAHALGTGTLSITSTATTFTLFNSTNADIILSTNNAQVWNRDLAIGMTGYANALYMGNGAVTLGANVELASITGMVFGIDGSISDGDSSYGLELARSGSGWAGTFILGGDNSFDGDLNVTGLNATLVLNHAGAIGNGRLLVNSTGIKLDNTSGEAITNSRATAQQWNYDFGFIGTNDLDLGTGAVNLGASGTDTTRTVTVSNGKLTVGGILSDGTNGTTTSLTKTGAGELVLGGNNTLTGNLNVNAGTLTLNGSNADVSGVILSAGRLNINHAAALGSNGLTLSGSGDKVIGNTSGGAITATLSSSNNWSRGFRYEGPQNMTLQGGSIAFSWTASTTQAIDVAAGTLTIRSGITGAGNRHFEKTGAGTLIFNAAFGEYIEYEGSTTVSEGKLQINSANSFAGSGAVRIGGAGTFEVQINGGNAHLENPVTVTGSGGTYRLLRANGTSYGDFALQSAIDSGQNTTVTIEGFSNGGFMEGRFALDTVAPTGPGQRMSDVFSLSGTADTAFILQLQIAPLTEGGEELYLGWNREGQWVNAILGNSLIGEGAGHFESSWQAAGIEATEFYLGAWGYDVASGSVWAVLDHNSEFAVMVVPEPGTYAMLGIGAALLACWRRRRRGQG